MLNRLVMMMKQPFTNDSYVKSLLHFDGSNGATTFRDEIGKTWTAAAGATITTTEPKFGTGAGLFDNSDNGYISTPDSDDWDFGSSPFTIDFWINATAFAANDTIIMHLQDGSNFWRMMFNSATVISTREYSAGSDKYSMAAAHGMSTGVWNHVAFIRGWGGDANSWAITINGSSIVTDTYSTTCAALSGDLVVGKEPGASGTSINAKLDELRISKGIARWTADFSASLPTTPYPNGK